MKLVWISHFLPFPSTGHGALQRTHHLVRQLASRFDVELYALSNGAGSESDILAMGVSRCGLFPAPNRAGKVTSLARGVAGPVSYWEHLFFDRAMHRAVVEAVRGAPRGEVLILLDTAFLAPYLEGLEDVPFVLNHHNVESDLLLQRGAMASGVKRWLFASQAEKTRNLEARLARRASSNLVVSAEDGVRLRAIAPGVATSVVANGVDVEFFSPSGAIAPVPYSLVFAGGMDWFPNRDAIAWLATELWPQLVADEPRRTLTIIGRSPPPEIQALAASDSRVRVLGFVPDVRPYIEGAWAYLCPIRIGGGTRLKVLDALAMGCPLVATTLSVDGLGLEDGTHFGCGNDAAGIVRTLRRLDTDEAMRATLVREGRALVSSQYSWDVIGERMAQALTSR